MKKIDEETKEFVRHVAIELAGAIQAQRSKDISSLLCDNLDIKETLIDIKKLLIDIKG